MLRRKLARALPLWLAVLSALVSSLAQAEQQRDPSEVTLISYNVWGVPHIAPSRRPRVRRIAREIAKLPVDVVLMQEVWAADDAATLKEGLAAGGLRFAIHFGKKIAKPSGSGLMIVSRYPIAESGFVAFAAGQVPHIPWHVDWMAKKGVASAVLSTPAGPLLVATTHFQANYRMGNYDAIQVGQAADVLQAMAQKASLPAILAGDLNARPNALAYRLIRERGGFEAAATSGWGKGIDVVFHRGPLSRDRVERCLQGKFDLDDQSKQALSDHPCVTATFRLTRSKPGAPSTIPPPSVAKPIEGLAATLASESVIAQRAGILAPLAGLLLLALTGAWVYRRPRPTRGVASVAMSAALAATALWLMYVGCVWAVAQHNLATSLQELL